MKQAQLVLVLLAGAVGPHAGICTAVQNATSVSVKCLPEGEGQIDVRGVKPFDTEAEAREAQALHASLPVAEGAPTPPPLNVCWPADAPEFHPA